MPPVPGVGEGPCFLCWDLGCLGWETGKGARLGLSPLSLAAKSPDSPHVPADSADPVGWVGLTYRAGGEPCIAPEDDTGCTQGGTFANGGDEIHLCGKGLVTGED